MTTYFITFGAGKPDYYAAGNRLLVQARNLNVFDHTKLYTDQDLKNDKSFWNQHSNFIETNPRGYGYWLWKPYIIKDAMDKMKDGDILLYLDCGCEFNIAKKGMIKYFLGMIKNEHIIGTRNCIEKQYNKMDLVEKLGMSDDMHLNTLQHQAGALLFLVCDKTRNLVNQWYEIGSDYHNIDDSPSILKNLDCFREHRHDQSIFSLLTKKYDLFSPRSLNCVEYIRNRTGVSKMNWCFENIVLWIYFVWINIYKLLCGQLHI